jgi:hypothetical protein
MINKRVLQKYVEEIDSVLAVNTMMNRSLFMNYCIMYTIHMCEKDAYTVNYRGIEYSIWVQRNNVVEREREADDDVNDVNNTVDYSLMVKDSLNNIPVEIYFA